MNVSRKLYSATQVLRPVTRTRMSWRILLRWAAVSVLAATPPTSSTAPLYEKLLLRSEKISGPEEWCWPTIYGTTADLSG